MSKKEENYDEAVVGWHKQGSGGAAPQQAESPRCSQAEREARVPWRSQGLEACLDLTLHAGLLLIT